MIFERDRELVQPPTCVDPGARGGRRFVEGLPGECPIAASGCAVCFPVARLSPKGILAMPEDNGLNSNEGGRVRVFQTIHAR